MFEFEKKKISMDATLKKKKNSKKSSSLLKSIGGRKGLVLASAILNNPKYKDLI